MSRLPHDMVPQFSSADAFVDAPDLTWVEAARDILHAYSAADELQHGLTLQEACCRDIHAWTTYVEGEA